MDAQLVPPLFDDIERHDPSPCGEVEDSFSFLNRVDTPFWEEVRRVTEEWFSRYPAPEAEGLRNAFRSRLPGQHHAAWWELYLHELFRRLGYEIEIHPELPDSAKTPDFLLQKGEARLYVEAAVVFSGIAVRESRSAPGWFLDAINTAKSPNFFVRLIEVAGKSDQQLKRREVADSLEAWLNGLDPDEVAKGHEREDRPQETFSCRHWEWTLEAWPVKPEARGRTDRRVLGIGMARSGWVNDVEQLKGTLKKKAGRYGHPKIPFVTAVRCMSGFMDRIDIEQALFGGETFQVPVDGRGEAELCRKRDGFWTDNRGPTNRRVSAVLIGVGIHEANVNKQAPSLWLNPWANHPLEEDWPFSKFTATDRGEIVEMGGEPDMVDLFDLPLSWPGDRPFPRD